MLRKQTHYQLNLPNPVIRSHYGNGFIKHYVGDHVILRTEHLI